MSDTPRTDALIQDLGITSATEGRIFSEMKKLERDSAAIIAQRAEHRANQAESERDALWSALPTPYRLRALADWIDTKYPNDPDPEVQTDLRKWADAIDAARKRK